MIRKGVSLFVVPLTEVLEVEQEKMICISGIDANRSGYGTATGEYEQVWE